MWTGFVVGIVVGMILMMAIAAVADERWERGEGERLRQRRRSAIDEAFRQGVRHERTRVTALLTNGKPRGLRGVVVKHVLADEDDRWLLDEPRARQ